VQGRPPHAEQLFGSPVDQGDPAPLVHHDDTIGHRVEGRAIESKPAENRLRRQSRTCGDKRRGDPVPTPPGRACRSGCHCLSIGRRMFHMIERVF
jgi:hypothetical protein